MARKSSKTSELLPDGDKTPSSRDMSIYEKIPVFADVRDRTEGEITLIRILVIGWSSQHGKKSLVEPIFLAFLQNNII